MLTNQLGRNWNDVLAAIHKGLKKSPTGADAIANLLREIVFTDVHRHFMAAKTDVYDATHFGSADKEPLEYGTIYVEPYTHRLMMVGYDLPKKSPPRPSASFAPLGIGDKIPPLGPTPEVEAEAELPLYTANFPEAPSKKKNKGPRLKKLSENTYLCKRSDGKWYDIRYTFTPRIHHFVDPMRNFGHIDFLRAAQKGKHNSYYLRKMNKRSLQHFGLEDDSPSDTPEGHPHWTDGLTDEEKLKELHARTAATFGDRKIHKA